jgi:hypothetical protein
MRVRSNALGLEPHTAIPQSTSFHLDPYEAALEIEHEVVTVIRSEGDEDTVAALDELGQNDRLGPLTDVNRMATEFRLGPED